MEPEESANCSGFVGGVFGLTMNVALCFILWKFYDNQPMLWIIENFGEMSFKVVIRFMAIMNSRS